jgi:tetratricopeptide (TPR) repeat protein
VPRACSGYHHLTNVLLHALGTVLLFLLLLRLTGARWQSAFVAFVFALHPLHVESVAWIAERKDVLSALFWFLTLWAYVRYVERPSPARYALMLLCFCCGLMSKPMIVTLPFVALLLDVWPLARFRIPGVILEKLPLFALSLAASVITYLVQQHAGAVLLVDQVPLPLRLENALVSYLTYIGKLIWPSNLAVFYPYPAAIPIWEPLLAGLAILGITAFAIAGRARRPYLVVGWLWYLVTLLPVIGLVQVGIQSRADRYTYVPMIGISIVLAWGAAQIAGRRTWGKQVLTIVSIAVCSAWLAVTWWNLAYWRDSASLFSHAIQVTGANYVAHNNLGAALRHDGKTDEAIGHFQSALEIRPAYSDAQNNLGEALLSVGRTSEAMPHIAEALRLRPGSPEAHINLGAALNKSGQSAEAAAQYHSALELNPGSAEAHCGLGVVLTDHGDRQQALAEFTEAIRLKPDYVDAHYGLGRLFGLAGRFDEAIQEFSTVIRLRPDDAEAHFNLGTALASEQKLAEALEEFRTAARLKPDYLNAHFNLGSALAQTGRLDDAIQEFKEALRIRPDFEEARQSLEYCRELLAQAGKSLPAATRK